MTPGKLMRLMEDLIQGRFACKHKKEIDRTRLRPHPYEFARHFDV